MRDEWPQEIAGERVLAKFRPSGTKRPEPPQAEISAVRVIRGLPRNAGIRRTDMCKTRCPITLIIGSKRRPVVKTCWHPMNIEKR
jgi:hypothetical protein